MQHIQDNVYAELISPGCNVGIVATGKGTLIVDTPLVQRQARAINHELAAAGRPPVRFIAVTHPHGDHILGTGLFGEDVLVIGNRRAHEKMGAHSPSWVRNWAETWSWKYPDDVEEMAAAAIALPNVVFDGELVLHLGGIEIWILPLPGHLAENVGVFVPAAGVLITGDALFCDHHPYMAEGNFRDWFKSLDKIGKLDPHRIIPGHGPVCGLEAVAKQQQYMQKMMDLHSQWDPARGNDAFPQETVDELLAFYPLHGRPEAVMRARIVESIRVAGTPRY
jgi:cyclase